MVNRRSKSGCWTCRLRRKKCPEDGLPCSNCESRGDACHGYGPRPAWKDRGFREREEVNRLQFQRRSHTPALRQSEARLRTHSSTSDSTYSSESCLTPSVRFAPASATDARPSLPQPCAVPPSFPVSPGMQATSPLIWDASEVYPEFNWIPDYEELLSMPTLCSDSAALLEKAIANGPANAPENAPANAPENGPENGPEDAPGNGPGDLPETAFEGAPENLSNQPPATPSLSLSSTSSALQFSSIRVTPSGEREIELMMQFLGEDFPKQHLSYQLSAITDRSWLMCMFKRSPTFLYASLGLSAYLNFHKASVHDGKRMEFFREYDHYRDIATKGHRALLEASREYFPPPADAVLGETNGALTGADSRAQTSILPTASIMERKAVEFFTYILIWVHILHCSTQQIMPLAANLYRQLLSIDSLSKSFVQTVGFEGWIVIALMDAIEISTWKREQEAKNRLSIRELVSKADAVISTLSQRLQ
ncbi:hypothetical protein LTR28_003776 [Elasticomyces elasticus]|nr:hypothetical protein LTR28_003776 [Elasticomyces elasticus]